MSTHVRSSIYYISAKLQLNLLIRAYKQHFSYYTLHKAYNKYVDRIARKVVHTDNCNLDR